VLKVPLNSNQSIIKFTGVADHANSGVQNNNNKYNSYSSYEFQKTKLKYTA